MIDKIIAAADIRAGDLVVEAGPGTGALTNQLALVAPEVFLIEADHDLIDGLKRSFPKATIIHADAATFDYEAHGIKGEWIFVSNLPYNAGNAIIMNVLEAEHPPKRLVVMVQHEVGERMLGRDPGLLTVAIALYADVEKVCKVPPGAFFPPPKVDSVVLKITPRRKPQAGNPERVLEIAKAGFANRRKQLHKNLADSGLFSSDEVKAKLTELGHSPLARAEELRLEDWLAFA